MLRFLNNKKGGVAVLTVAAITVLLGCTAMVVDAGIYYYNRTQLSNMVDAAVLAGAQELLDGSPSQAVSTGEYYTQINGRQPGDTVQFDISVPSEITATATRTVPAFFARIFKIMNFNPTATATARIEAINSYIGVVPLGVVQDDFVFGSLYTLKVGGGDGLTGNYGALALGGNGGRQYGDNLKYGYDGQLFAEQWVSTETGNIAGPTKQAVDFRISQDPNATYATVASDSARVVTLPVVYDMTVNGKGQVQIKGFAAFFLEDGTQVGNECQVTGRFLRWVTPTGGTSPTQPSYGLYGVRLIR